MAKTKITKTPTLYDKPWKHGVAVVIGIILAYSAMIWAVDSGKLLVYAASFVLTYLTAKHLVLGIIQLKDRK